MHLGGVELLEGWWMWECGEGWGIMVVNEACKSATFNLRLNA